MMKNSKEEMIIEKVDWGYKVLSGDGNKELTYVNTLKEAKEFVKDNNGVAI